MPEDKAFFTSNNSCDRTVEESDISLHFFRKEGTGLF